MKIILINKAAQKQCSLNESQLARLAVELHGGGYNEDQVASAMDWQRKVLDGKTPIEFEVKGIRFTVEAKSEGVAA